MGKYREINHYMEYRKRENTREIKIIKMKLNLNRKKQLSDESLKYSKNIILYKYKKLNEFLKIIILLINFISLFVKLNQKKLIFNLTEIILKVKGVGNIKILSDYFFQRYNQCEIYINGILQNITNNSYYLNHTENEDIEYSNNITYLNNTQNIDLSTSKNEYNEYNYSNILEIDEYSEISKLGKHYTERIKSVMFTNEELFIDFENQSSDIT